MIYDCCVRQKKCRSILKHVLKRCGNRKSCRRPVVMLVACDKIVSCKSALTVLRNLTTLHRFMDQDTNNLLPVVLLLRFIPVIFVDLAQLHEVSRGTVMALSYQGSPNHGD